jgi:hypothetical protein
VTSLTRIGTNKYYEKEYKMKRTTTAILITVLASGALLNAQLLRSYGVKVGAVSAYQSFDYAANTGINASDLGLKRRAGFGAGIFCEWLNLPIVSAVTQLEYRQGGVGMKHATVGTNGEILGSTTEYSRIDYLSVAALAKVRFPGMIVNPYLMAGPRFDRMVGNSDTLYNQFRKNVTGLSFGCGAELPKLLPLTILAEMRYDLDLGDFYSSQNLTVKNNSFSAWLGIGF